MADNLSHSGPGDNVGRDKNVYLPLERPSRLFYPQDIKNIVDGFSICLESISSNYHGIKSIPNEEFLYTEKEEKNKLNSLSDDYFQTMKQDYLADFYKIDNFLRDPKNELILKKYNNIAKLFRNRIVGIRHNHTTFDDVLQTICTEMFDCREELLTGNEYLSILLVNYMYWNCDIGKKV